MSYPTITKCQDILRISNLALGQVIPMADVPEKYDIIHDAYEAVRTLQGEDTPTDHGHTTYDGMVEYLEESISLCEDALGKAEAEIVADNLVPTPLPVGIVLDGGSGSGSGL